MKLIGLTITGADDSVDPETLADISREFPFVEWAILVGSNYGSPRFPSTQWLDAFMATAKVYKMNVALHVCGRWLKSLVCGRMEVPAHLTDYPQRIQLNFHGQPHNGYLMDFISALTLWQNKKVIFQIDDRDGTQWFARVNGHHPNVNTFPLFDMSHGAGVLPEKWPMSYPTMREQGYAGGLGPDNLAEELPKIAAAAGLVPFWVDMETRVRTPNNQRLDLGAVVEVLTIVQPFVRGVDGVQEPASGVAHGIA